MPRYLEIFSEHPWYGTASGELRRIRVRERVRGKAYAPYDRLKLDESWVAT